MFFSVADTFFLTNLNYKMSWTEKKSSAEALFHQDDFEKAMERYNAAGKAASDQNANP
jgi:hypothetical protein